jgi:hypothetical protein
VTPPGIRSEVPVRNLVTLPGQQQQLLLVFLVIYVGESQPLTRTRADAIRIRLVDAVQAECGNLEISKNYTVSRSFPYSIVDSLIAAREESNQF